MAFNLLYFAIANAFVRLHFGESDFLRSLEGTEVKLKDRPWLKHNLSLFAHN